MRFCGVLLCLLFVALETYAQEVTSDSYYHSSDTISPIIPPWDQIQLTGTYMKPGIAFRIQEVLEQSSFPWWILATGGGVAGGLTTYLLTREKNDTQQEPLSVTDDKFVIECGAEGIILDVLKNDQGAELTILTVDAVSGGQLSIQQNTISVSNPSDQMIRFRYTVEDKYGNTASAEVLVQVKSSSLRAVDDNYETRQFYVEGNLLENDMGRDIEIVHHEPPLAGKLVIEPNGAFNYTGTGQDTGQIQFLYVIEDKCKNRDMATCWIDIKPPPCDMKSTVNATPAECGRADGSAVITVDPEGDYQYTWPDGSMLSERNDLAAGTYEVIIKSEYCADTVSIEIEEKPAEYALQATGIPGNCVEGGDIELTYDHSLDGDLIIAVSGPSGTAEYSTSNRTGVSISDYAPVLPGNYTIEVWNALSGRSCSQTTEVLVPDNTPELIVNDDVYTTAFRTAIEINVLSNDMGLGLILSGVQEVTGGQVESLEDGTVVFTPGEEFYGMASFRYMVTDGCGQEAEGQVTITVGEPDCTMDAEFTIQKANCGRADGSASITVYPEGNYQYSWSEGSTGPELNDVVSGKYSVEVRRVGTPCLAIFMVTIGEKNPDYINDIQTRPVTCKSAGEIQLNLTIPPAEKLVIQVIYGDDFYEVNTGNTPIFLSEYFPVMAGDYKLKVFAKDIGMTCLEEAEVTVEDIRSYPKIKLTDKFPPTSPSSIDGVVTGEIIVPTAPPYGIYLNGMAVGATFENQFKIGNMGYGEYAVFVVDANGCQSNTEAVYFAPEEGLQFHLESGYITSHFADQQREHPDQYDTHIHLMNRVKATYYYNNGHFLSFSAGYGMAWSGEDRILGRYETSFSKGARRKWTGRSVDISGGMVWSVTNYSQNYGTHRQQYGAFLGTNFHPIKSIRPFRQLRFNFEGYLFVSDLVYPELRCNIGF